MYGSKGRIFGTRQRCGRLTDEVGRPFLFLPGFHDPPTRRMTERASVFLCAET